MRAFLAIVRVTIRQVTGRTRALGFAALCLAPAGLLFAASRARNVEGLDTDLGGLVVTPFFAVVLPLISLILAGAALGDERRDKTLSFLVLRPLRRLEIAAGKVVAASLVAIAFALLGSLALVLTYAAVGGTLDVFPSIFLGAAVTCVLYCSVFALLGNVTSRPTLVGLLYIVFIETMLAAELPRLAPVSIWRIGLASTIDVMPQGYPARALLGAIGELPPSAVNGLVATGITAVVATAVCTVLLARTDSV